VVIQKSPLRWRSQLNAVAYPAVLSSAGPSPVFSPRTQFSIPSRGLCGYRRCLAVATKYVRVLDGGNRKLSSGNHQLINEITLPTLLLDNHYMTVLVLERTLDSQSGKIKSADRDGNMFSHKRENRAPI
jgi:hypothetical protein